MADTPLATPADAQRLGYGVLTEAALARASARARGFTNQNFLTKTDTTRARGGRLVAIPGKPLQAIISVVDTFGNPVRWQERSNGAIFVDSAVTEQSELVDITYRAGWDTLPDKILDVICTIASRLDKLNPALASGAQTESGGDESITFGWDSHKGVSGLVAEEEKRLARLFPKVHRAIVMSA